MTYVCRHCSQRGYCRASATVVIGQETATHLRTPRDEEEPPGATCVMYPREKLHAIEVSIADRLVEFDGLGDAVRESSWLASYFGRDYPSDLPKREVIEDIVTRELNGDFIGVFRCPACHRVAIKAEDSDRWKFYRAEPG